MNRLALVFLAIALSSSAASTSMGAPLEEEAPAVARRLKMLASPYTVLFVPSPRKPARNLLSIQACTETCNSSAKKPAM